MHLPVQRTLTSMEWSQPWRPVGEKNLLHSSTVSLNSEQASWSRKMGPDPADTVGIVREAVDRTVVHGDINSKNPIKMWMVLTLTHAVTTHHFCGILPGPHRWCRRPGG